MSHPRVWIVSLLYFVLLFGIFFFFLKGGDTIDPDYIYAVLEARSEGTPSLDTS